MSSGDPRRNLVERIDAFGKNLSGREIDLVANCLEQIRGGRILTDRQRPWLEDIDDRCV